MPRRPAQFTQADIARAIRAVKAAGLPVVRIVIRPDGIAVETERGSAVLQSDDEGPVAEGPPVDLV